MKKKQAKTHNSTALRQHLIASRFDGSVTLLAEAVKHPRPSVSAALHHGCFPRIVSKIREALRG